MTVALHEGGDDDDDPLFKDRPTTRAEFLALLTLCIVLGIALALVLLERASV